MNPYYDYNVATLKKYGDRYKITLCNCIRKKGYELTEKEKLQRQPRGSNPTKLDNNISRAKSTIFELAMCNKWDYFATLTLSPENYDRTDLKKYQKDLSNWIRDRNKYRKEKIRYLIIPEKHKKGDGWHLHGLFTGITKKDLEVLTLTSKIFKNGKIPLYILNRLGSIYTWTEYHEKFGYCVLERIHNKNKISSYLMKYFTKDISRNVTRANSRLFYSSQGLKRAIDLHQGRIVMPELFIADYEGEYTKIKWIEKNETALINDILDINLDDLLIINDKCYNINNVKYLSPKIKNSKILRQHLADTEKFLQQYIDNKNKKS